MAGPRPSLWLLALIAGLMGCTTMSDDATGQTAVLRFDPSVTHQTIEGWGATLPTIGIPFEEWIEQPTLERYDELPVTDPLPEPVRLGIIDAAVSDLGLNRFRLEIGPQVEVQNDNDDPQCINWAAFRFRWQDMWVEKWVLPLKERIERRGESLVLYISYDLRSSLTPEWLLQPDEYAEMAVATLTHLKRQYALEPDYWSVLNEPGNHRPGDPELVARLIAATGERIQEAGFRTRVSGPEIVTPGQITAYMEACRDTPGALARLGQLTYHLYWDPENISNRHEIRDWARKLGVTSAQTEWMEGDALGAAQAIHLDLTEADASAWEQYSLCFTENPYNIGGAGDYFVIEPDYSSFRMNGNAWYLRQYMKYIRPGAVRVEVTSSAASVKPVGFLSATGEAVLVAINAGSEPQEVEIEGLPQGEYAVVVTTPEDRGTALADVSVGERRQLRYELPASAVITFAQAGGAK